MLNKRQDRSTRKADLQDVANEFNGSQDLDMKQRAERTARKIQNESGLVRSMRKKLLHEASKGNWDNVYGIRKSIEKKDRYKNG